MLDDFQVITRDADEPDFALGLELLQRRKCLVVQNRFVLHEINVLNLGKKRRNLEYVLFRCVLASL